MIERYRNKLIPYIDVIYIFTGLKEVSVSYIITCLATLLYIYEILEFRGDHIKF